jgi:hypothetical protein
MRLWSLLRSVVRLDSKGEEDMNRTNTRGICALYDRCRAGSSIVMGPGRKEVIGLLFLDLDHERRSGRDEGVVRRGT